MGPSSDAMAVVDAPPPCTAVSEGLRVADASIIPGGGERDHARRLRDDGEKAADLLGAKSRRMSRLLGLWRGDPRASARF